MVPSTAIEDMGSPTTGPSISDIASVFARQWRALVIGLALATAAFILWRVFIPKRYSATGSFAAQYGGSHLGSFGGLASQLGVDISGDPSQSPAFYAELLGTRTVRIRLLESRVRAPGARDSTPLIDLIVPDKSLEHDERIERGVLELSSMVFTPVSVRTGVVTVQAISKERWLSAAMVNKLIYMVDDYNQRVRRSSAKAEREFLSRRVDEQRAEWRAAQGQLARFNETNRDLRNSPDKALERERLATDVNLRRDAFTATTASLEQARIEEVRNTPAVTILEEAGIPLRPLSRRSWIPFLLTLALTFLYMWVADMRRMRQQNTAVMRG